MTTNTNDCSMPLPLPISKGGLGSTNVSQARDALLYPNPAAKNLIVGGNLDMNPWQRAQVAVQAPDNTWTADMFSFHKNTAGQGQIDIGRINDSPSVGQSGILSDYCYWSSVNTAQSDIGPTEYFLHRTRVEDINYAAVSAGYLTLSFWVKSNRAGTYSVSLNMGAYYYVAEYSINSQNTWEYKSITIPPIGQAINSHLYINWVLAAGDDYKTSFVNTWQPVVKIASVNQINAFRITSISFMLQFVQLEAGQIPTDFELQDYAETLKQCQRYCEKSYGYLVNPATNTSRNTEVAVISTVAGIPVCEFIYYKTRKRTANQTVQFWSRDGVPNFWEFQVDGLHPIVKLDITPTSSGVGNGLFVRTLNSFVDTYIYAFGHYLATDEF